jgi:MFS family permease
MGAHHISRSLYGSLIAINGILIVFLQPLMVPVLERMRRGRVLAMGALLVGLGFGLTALAHMPLHYALTIVVWTFGEIAFIPVAPTVVADLAPTRLRGSYQGAYQLAWGAASCAAPAVGGFVLGHFGNRALWAGCLVAGVLGAIMHVVISPARRRRLVELHASEDGAAREDGVRAA